MAVSYQSKFAGVLSRLIEARAMPELYNAQVAEAKQRLQVNELRMQGLRFQNDVVRPMEVKRMEMDLQRQQAGAITQGMEMDLQRQQLQDQADTYEAIHGMRSRFQSTPLVERDWEAYANEAEELYRLNPSEQTYSHFLQAAQMYVGNELQNKSASHETEIERLQNLRNRYVTHPELTGLIEPSIEKEFRRPGYLAAQYKPIKQFLPPHAQAVLDKAEQGRALSGDEVETVRRSVAIYEKMQASQMMHGDEMSDTVILNYDRMGPAGRDLLKQKHGGNYDFSKLDGEASPPATAQKKIASRSDVEKWQDRMTPQAVKDHIERTLSGPWDNYGESSSTRATGFREIARQGGYNPETGEIDSKQSIINEIDNKFEF